MADTGHTRVLDLDLDLFVHGVAHHVVPRSGERLSDDEYPVWDVDDAIAYLRTTCLLDGPLPGCAVEHHGELFDWWRDGIQRGQLVPPFDVAHLDAHADLGEGESSWSYLLREVLFWDLERRQYPKEGEGHLTDGSYLAFAVACHWVAKVDYVYCPGGGSDLSPMVMEGFDGHGDHVHLAPISKAAYRALMDGPARSLGLKSNEPRVPIRQIKAVDYQAAEPFDVVCLSRSPEFTPPGADAIYDAIRDEFIDA